ncbi:MAG: hypothetical protein KDB14_34455 [Planctomycetales bacterium]|nr:hypothetical protein [Planctomycetales bacterium]
MTRLLTLCLLAAATLSVLTLAGSNHAQDPNPSKQNLREMRERAEQLRRDGNAEQAEAIERQLKAQIAEQRELTARSRAEQREIAERREREILERRERDEQREREHMEQREREGDREHARFDAEREELSRAMDRLLDQAAAAQLRGAEREFDELREQLHQHALRRLELELQWRIHAGRQLREREAAHEREERRTPDQARQRQLEELEMRMREVREDAEQAARQGRPEIAERLQREAAEIQRHMQELHAGHNQPHPPHPEGMGDVQHALRELGGAVDRLHHENAELRERVERLERRVLRDE